MKRACSALRRYVLFTSLFVLVATTGWTATYYVSNSGSDSNNGLSTSSPWKTISKVNGRSFSPGDTILFRRGDVWREQLVVPSSGTSGSPITFGAYGTGAAPIISGSDVRTGFSQYSGNIWRCSNVSTSRMVFFQKGTAYYWGVLKSGTGSLSREYDYYIGGGYLYVYAPSDPDSRYTNVLYGVRDNCIVGNGKDYVTIENLEINCTGKIDTDGNGGIRIDANSDNWIIQDCHIHHHGIIGSDSATQIGNCIFSYGGDNITIRRNDMHDAGRHIVCSYPRSGVTASNVRIYSNRAYNTAHNNIDIHDGGGTYDGVYIYNNDIFQEKDFPYGHNLIYLSQGANKVYVYYNLIHDAAGNGIQCSYDGDGPIYIYGNTFYNNSHHVISYVANAHPWVLRNNIFHSARTAPIRCTSASNWSSDYNCFYQTANSTVARVGSTSYSNWSSYRSATGWDAHSTWSVNPNLTNPAGSDFTLRSTSPCIDKGSNLGSQFQNGLDPASLWPGKVIERNQNDNGSGWEIGAYVYGSTYADTTPPRSPTGVRVEL
ncbi:MAG: right-handed parallel beta-helix repeat-containing protein [Desulfomonilia bacterium]|jgi:hypothetical protein